MPLKRDGRDFVGRHGETVFNASRRLQGDTLHTPLTRNGVIQAMEMGQAMRDALGARPALTLWASPTGRALQTLAIIADYLDLDWHSVRTDERLTEIGMGSWGGRYYAELTAEVGPVILPGGLLRSAPDGERYDQIATRVAGWLADTAADPGDRLGIMHGISSRVMRGVMTGAPMDACGAPVLPGHPQGTVTMIEGGRETMVHLGTGHAPA